jgi:chemotaxis protein CheC
VSLEFTPEQIDLLREVSTIGSGHAATALSQLLDRRIMLHVPNVKVIPVCDVPDVVGGAEKLVAGLFFRVYGQAKGSILILFPKDSALVLVRELLKKDTSSAVPLLKDMEISALKEVGNILAAAYLNAISQMLQMVLIPSVPGLAYDMAGAVLDSLLIELSQVSETALLIETEFVEESRITGHFFLLPDPESLRLIFETLGKK